MRLISTAWLGFLGLLIAGPAEALTISNAGLAPQTVTVTAGKETTKLVVEPAKNIDAPCPKGCTVKLESGDAYQLKGNESVSIEDGALFIDDSPDAYAEGLPDLDPDTVPDKPGDDEDDEDDNDDNPDEDASK